MRILSTPPTHPAPPTSPHDDVLVIGAGLAGLPTALALADRGLRVRVLDRGAPGAATSHVAAGMLAPVSEATADRPQLLHLGLLAAERWPAFDAELAERAGHGADLREHGTLVVARDRDEAEAAERERGIRERLGVAVQRLAPTAARRLEPALSPHLRLALDVPGDHACDPRRAVAALVRACERAGVVLQTGEDGGVAEVLVDRDRARGVRLVDGRRLRAAHVVLAAGPWSGTVAGVPDEARVPVRPLKGELLVLRDPSGPGLVTRTLRFDPGYLVPRADGRYVLGATLEEQGFDTRTTARALHDLLRDGAELVPGLLELEVVEALAGLRPTTPDALPAVGPAPGVDGLWWATGHHRDGALLASVTGPLLAGQLAGGLDADLAGSAAELAPSRFATVADASRSAA